ncbi:MAG: ATPase, partial [Proteobacteria bacterium]
DLISCRNVLIYLGLHLQKKLIPVFHYGLKNSGYLFLGTSESLSSHKDLFKTISSKHRIAQRKATAIRPGAFTAAMSQNLHQHPHEAQRNHEADIHLISQRIVLDEFSSRYAVINDEYQIISVSAGLQVYLDPAEGTFQNHIVKMVRSGLRVSLRAALNDAKKHKRKIDVESATLKFDDGIRRVGITVQPMPQLGDESGLYMVVFHKLNKLENELRPNAASGANTEDHSELVEQLERELSILREDLEKTVQDLEASNEELKSSNEELLSMNEELQSANEELETSKEDVQLSSEALQQTHTDLENLLASTDIATLFLNESLQIQSFTPALEEVYNITSSDIGRPINHFTHLAKVMPDYPNPATVVKTGTTSEDSIELQDGRHMLRRISPYRTAAGTFSGMVVTFIDVTKLRTAEDLRPKLRSRLVEAIEASGLGREDYTLRVANQRDPRA